MADSTRRIMVGGRECVIERDHFKEYRKKPIVVRAVQINESFEVETLEGTMQGSPGDWLIIGVKGEVYPCKPDVFAASYVSLEVARVGDEIRVMELKAQKDAVYKERDALIAALSKMFPAHLCRHPDSDLEWENDWRWIVCIHLPTGQATWHIHDSELPMFVHLKEAPNHWDGHGTEEKYRRLKSFVES